MKPLLHHDLEDVKRSERGSFLERYQRLIFISMIVAGLLYLSFALWSGAAELWESFLEVGYVGFACVLGLALVSYTLRFWRWHLYLKWLGFWVPPAHNSRFFLASFAFTATPGKFGEAVRSIFLKPYNVPYRSSLSALLVERLFDLAILSLASLGIVAYSRYSAFALLPLLGIALVLFALHSRKLRARLPAKARGFLEGLNAATSLSQGWPLVIGLLIGVSAWMSEALAFHVLLHLMGASVPLLMSIGIYGLAITLGALSFLPGGLGGTEAVMIALLGVAGVNTVDAGAATLLFRFGTLWFAVMIGLGALVGLERSQPNHLLSNKKPDAT